jgi:hypothetical protein
MHYRFVSFLLLSFPRPTEIIESAVINIGWLNGYAINATDMLHGLWAEVMCA